LIADPATTGEAVKKTAEQQKLEKINKELQEKQKKLTETRAKERAALSKFVVTKKQLAKTRENLNLANNKIVKNQKKLNKLASDIEATRDTIDIKSKKLKKRIVEVYKSSSVNYLEMLFSATSMADFINRSYFFSKVIGLDASLVQSISQTYHKIKGEKEELSDTTTQIRQLAADISDKKKKIAAQAEEIKDLYDDLKDRRQRYEKQVAELEASSAKLEKEILAKTSGKYGQMPDTRGSTGSLDWPLRGRITSTFGYRRNPFGRGRNFHTGLDVAAPYGEVIRAADGGEVILAGWWNGYGKAIVIDHGKGRTTVYGHMSRLYMQAGNQVKKGQIIGLVGSTGYSTGPHLHFEVRIKGKPTNPKQFLP